MAIKPRKRKRQQPRGADWVTPERARSLLAELDRRGRLPPATALDLAGWGDAGPCRALEGGCPKQTKDGLRCFCSAAPPKDGAHRKEGLWSKNITAKVLHSRHGTDPSLNLRTETTGMQKRVGLQNLGQTCYVNSALQCLFANAALRQGLYSLKDPWAQQDVIMHLRRLFAELQAGPRAVASPQGFAACLNLDKGVQQDGGEFLKLLLTLLESQLAGSPQDRLVQRMYRGHFVYSTTCQKCKRQSDRSSVPIPFYELELTVKGFPSLQTSLATMLDREMLEGSNQYCCNHCNTKVDAVRQMQLRELPPVLCFSLMRFVFDMTTLSKVKVSDNFSFPMALDMSPLIAPGNAADGSGGQLEAGQEYELAGVLIHKGRAATSGHYVAQVRDETSGVWVEYNDEEVKELGDYPSGFADPAGPKTSTASRSAGAGKKKASRGKAKDSSNGKAETSGVTEAPEVTEVVEPSVSSKDAYLLVYRRKGYTDNLSITVESEPQLSDDLLEWVNKEAVELNSMATGYMEMKADVEAAMERRQQTVREVTTALACTPEECDPETVRFLDIRAVGKWANASGFEAELRQDSPEVAEAATAQAAGPLSTARVISNSGLLCSHGLLKLCRGSGLRAIPEQTWRALWGRVDVEPELGQRTVCWDCLRADLQTVSVAEADDNQREEIAQLVQEVLAEDQKPSGRRKQRGQRYLMPSTWLRGWLNRSCGQLGNVSPTGVITCKHGRLVPESVRRTSRVYVPERLWHYVREGWASQGGEVRPATPVEKSSGVDKGDTELIGDTATKEGESSLPVLTEFQEGLPVVADCPECCHQEQSIEKEISEEKEARAEERAQVRMLAEEVMNVKLEAGQSCWMIPSAWLTEWRDFVKGKVRAKKDGGGLSPRPSPLTVAICMMLCECKEHRSQRQLLVRPPRLELRRGRWGLAACAPAGTAMLANGSLVCLDGSPSEPSQALVPVTDEEWLILSDRYGGDSRTAGIRATVVETIGSAGGQPAIGGEELAPMGLSPGLQFVTEPPLCQATMESWAQARRLARLTYTGAEILTTVCKDEDAALKASLEAMGRLPVEKDEDTGGTATLAPRRAKRSRRQGVATLLSDSTDCLSALKGRLWEALEIHPGNARMFCRGRELRGDDRSLADVEVTVDDELFIVDTGEFDADDVQSIVPWLPSGVVPERQGKGSRAGPERGFMNTKLVSSAVAAEEKVEVVEDSVDEEVDEVVVTDTMEPLAP